MSALTLADAKTHLGLTDSTQDVELQATIDAAEAVIAQHVGPLTPTAVTVRVHGGAGPLSLPILPAISLTSVTPSYGNAIDITTLDVDPRTGLVGWIGYSSNYTPYFPLAYYTVVYQAGWSPLPADLLYAIKEMVRHLWQTQRGAGVRPGQPADTTAPSYLLPYRVSELLAPYEQVTFA